MRDAGLEGDERLGTFEASSAGSLRKTAMRVPLPVIGASCATDR
jgi:hypothetical protein